MKIYIHILNNFVINIKIVYKHLRLQNVKKSLLQLCFYLKKLFNNIIIIEKNII